MSDTNDCESGGLKNRTRSLYCRERVVSNPYQLLNAAASISVYFNKNPLIFVLLTLRLAKRHTRLDYG